MRVAHLHTASCESGGGFREHIKGNNVDQLTPVTRSTPSTEEKRR